MSKTIYDVNWIDLIPPSISRDSQVKGLSVAVCPQLQEVSNVIREILSLQDWMNFRKKSLI